MQTPSCIPAQSSEQPPFHHLLSRKGLTIISEVFTLDTFYRVIVPILASISSGVIAFCIYVWNRGKEKHHFRICCYCLLEETSLHNNWLTYLLDGDPNIGEIILSSDATREFDAIKYDSVMRHMSKDDFAILFQHYKNITSVRWVIKKSAEQGIRKIVMPERLSCYIADCEKAICVLKRYSQQH